VIKRPVVLVLGAGASRPYGFPTARDLLRDIRGGFRDDIFRRRLVNSDYGETEIRELREALNESPVGSVDEFLELTVNARLVPVGKAAIAAALLPLERPEKLLPDAQPDDWYEHLFRRMRDRAPSLDKFLMNRVAFVTFNYDRSLEHFLLTSLRSTYGAKPAEIAEAMKRRPLHIVHVYGSLGELPDLGGELPYGVEPTISGILLRHAAESIRIAGEPGSQAGIDAAESVLMSHGERVCFLGFGYRRENVERLSLATTLPKDARIFGSAYEKLRDERGDVERLFEAAGRHIELADPKFDGLKTLKDLPVLSESGQ